jgi:integrase
LALGLRRFARRVPVLGAVRDYLRRWEPVYPDEVAQQFHGSGYLIFDPEIPPDILDRAVADTMIRPEATHNLHHGSRWFDGWKESRAIRDIALAPKVLRLLRQLYGREPRPFQTLNFPIGTEQKVHSDAIHFYSDPPTYMCGVWVALEDIDLDNGALVYYPGSHKLPVVTMEDVAPGPGPEYYPLYEAYIEKLVAQRNLEPAYAVLKKGQALLWAANLLHGGSSHRDKTRTRHSQVTHYFFDGCQYYMPLGSYGGYRHLKKEEWVR